jgi:arabinogalactan oligomer / maltooligosaccharide transport system substrate-binding protein
MLTKELTTMLLRWKIPALLLALTVLMAACGGDDTGDTVVDDPTDAVTEEPTVDDEATDDATEDETAEEPEEEATEEVVRADADLVIWADDTRAPALRPFAEEFGEQEGLTVAVQEIPFDQIRDRLQVAGPAGEGPDVIVGAHDWLGELVTNGVVEPIDLGGAEGDYAEVAIQAFTYDGQLYGLPYATENIALVRNTDLVPEAPATWEELESTALELQESGEVERGLVIQASDVYHHYPFVTSQGGYVFAQDDTGSYDPSDVGIDSEGSLEAAELIRGWVESGLLNPDVDYDVMINSFGGGEAAFAITGPWAVAQADTGFRATGVHYAVSPIPDIDGGTPAPFVGVQGFMVSAFAENALLAQTFVTDFLGTEDAQLALFEVGSRPPALLSAFEQVSDDPDIQGFGESGQAGVPMPAVPEMGSVWSAWEDAYNLVYEGQGDPRDNFQNAAEQVRSLIQG